MFLILRTPIVWYNLGVMIQPYIAIAVAFGIAGLLALPGAMGLKLRMIRLKSAELVLFLAMAAIGTDNNIYTNTIVATSRVDKTDILIGLLQSEMPLIVGTGQVIPEPSSAILLLVGCAVLVLRRKRCQQKTSVRA